MKIGDRGRIVRLLPGDSGYRRRLIALGLIPGTELVVNHIAPLGDPIAILVRGVVLSLRQAEAKVLDIEWLGNEK